MSLIINLFVGKYKGASNQSLTEKEQKDNFTLELVSINKLEKIVLNNQNNNPRNIHFVKELLTLLKRNIKINNLHIFS